MLCEQLAPGLEALVTGLELGESNDLVDARGEFGGEGRIGNNVLDIALRVGSNQADAERGRRVQGVREADFSRLQAVLVHHVLLGGEDKPHGFIVQRCVLVIGLIVVANQSLLRRRLFLLVLAGLDVSQQCGGSFLDLRVVSRRALFLQGL